MSMRNVQRIPDLPYKINEFQDITDTLARKTTGEWEPDRTPEQITHISIHHSGTENGTIAGYANYHVNNLGWRSIGYHLVIKGDQVYQVNDLLSFSYHTASNNAYTIGISVSADLSKRPMSEMERLNLYAAILTVMDLFKIPVENVLGHNQYPGNATSCPCVDMQKLRDDIRMLQAKIDYAKSDAAAKSMAHLIGNKILFLVNLAAGKDQFGNPAGEGDITWGRNFLLEFEPYLRERGLL